MGVAVVAHPSPAARTEDEMTNGKRHQRERGPQFLAAALVQCLQTLLFHQTTTAPIGMILDLVKSLISEPQLHPLYQNDS
jgi:hypothetical protein